MERMRLADELGPATKFAAIAPAAVDLDPRPRALWVNQACDLELVDEDGNSETFTCAGAGPVDVAPVQVVSCSAGTVIGLY